VAIDLEGFRSGSMNAVLLDGGKQSSQESPKKL
jgi:hypothetical protein